MGWAQGACYELGVVGRGFWHRSRMSVPEVAKQARYRCRIAMTGGPGGGKTTAADMLRREIGERIVVVPESATMLFSGGFPRCEEVEARKAVQRAIFHVQRNIEEVQSARYPGAGVALQSRDHRRRGVLAQRRSQRVLHRAGTTLEQELRRYDAVLFFETAAVGDL